MYSPLMFIAYIDRIIREVKEEISEMEGYIMAYADDLEIWSESREEIERIVSCFVEILRDKSLQMNIEKTELPTMDRERHEKMGILG